MILTNYHTHCTFCDGKAEAEEMVQAAIEKGFQALGFSSHAPVPFETDWTLQEESLGPYINRIQELKGRYQDKIEIYLGLEIDYIENLIGPSSPQFEKLPLDYCLGSVHFIRNSKTGEYLTVDGPIEEFEAILKDTFNGDVKALVGYYYQMMKQMLMEHNPDIIAHLDLYKTKNKDNIRFNEEESWHRNLVESSLKVIAEKGTIVEINTGGYARGKTSSIYPSPWILEMALGYGIPVMVNSDAHTPETLDTLFTESIALLKEIGYTHHMAYLKNRWQEVPL